MVIVLIKDLHVEDLGYGGVGGLLHAAGSRLDNCLPQIEKKLLAEGFAVPEEEWKQQQAGKAKQQPLKNKRRRPYASEDKAR